MKELKQAIQDASSVLLVTPENISNTDYLACLQIQKIAPDKIHLFTPSQKEQEWEEVFGSAPSKKEFAIRINTKLSPIDELRYEKDDSGVTIFLAHKNTFNSSALSFGEFIPPSDLFITIGFSEQKNAERAIENLPRKGVARHISLPSSTPLLNTEEPLNKNKLSPQEAALLGRCMVRSREDEEVGVLWSFIIREDFEKTNASPESIPDLIEVYARLARTPDTILVFWQHNDAEGTEGLIWSSDTRLLEAVSTQYAKPYNGKRIVPLGMFEDFIEAETSLRKLLKTLGKGTINP